MAQPYPSGTILDVGGAFAVYYEYCHPCHDPYDQWVIFHQEGAVEVTLEEPRKSEGGGRPVGRLPFMSGGGGV